MRQIMNESNVKKQISKLDTFEVLSFSHSNAITGGSGNTSDSDWSQEDGEGN